MSPVTIPLADDLPVLESLGDSRMRLLQDVHGERTDLSISDPNQLLLQTLEEIISVCTGMPMPLPHDVSD